MKCLTSGVMAIWCRGTRRFRSRRYRIAKLVTCARLDEVEESHLRSTLADETGQLNQY